MADRFNILDKPSKAPAASVSVSGATYADRKTRTSGNLTLNSTTWANVDNNLDITLPAKAGDWVEYGVSVSWNDEAVDGVLDAVTVVSGSPVKSLGDSAAPDDTHLGVLAWWGVTGTAAGRGGSVLAQLDAGDVENGQVKLRLRYRTGAATNKTLFASATFPLVVFARNLG